MAVIDGQDANAATFNAAFGSKQADNTFTGKQGLARVGSGTAITDVQQAINDVIDSDALKIPTSEKGAALGVAPLNASAQIDSAYLPSYVDDVLEYANTAGFPVSGESGKLYLDLATAKIYRWSGSIYIEVSQGITDHAALSNIGTNTHAQIDSFIGNAPVSATQQTAIDLKNVNIQFKDEGSVLGTSGTVDEIDFVGAGISVARVGNKLTVTSSGGGGGSTAPTIQRFTSGSGTYNKPVGCVYIKVKLAGAGGGGGGSDSGGAGSAGTSTTFGTSLLTANGGAGGASDSIANPMAGGGGGAVTVSAPASANIALSGGNGGSGSSQVSAGYFLIGGGTGGMNPIFSGGGNGAGYNQSGNAGLANTGGGGQGGSAPNLGNRTNGAGGGAGGAIDAVISSPSSTYSYSVGSGGAGGGNGGAGGSGVIIVEEYY